MISKLIKGNLVNGLPNLNLDSNHVCKACQLEKHTRISFKPKNAVTTTRPLELLRMDLFGPTRTTNLGGKKYGLVIIDDYSRYTLVSFITHKNETFFTFLTLFKRLTNEKNTTINSIRTDHGSEFDNIQFKKIYIENEIDHNFLAPRTHQQNRIVERKNRTLEEMAYIMLCENNLPRYFWTKAMNIVCYFLTRALIRLS